jgi:hypothetical protein
MSDRQTCVDCHELSPETETNYTLIGSRFGWRITRRKDADGNMLVEWRCPACWRAYKAARNESVPQSTRFGPGIGDPASGTRRAASPAPNDDGPTQGAGTTPRRARSVPPQATRKR